MTELLHDWLLSEGIETEIDLLYCSPESFKRKPQVGEPRKMTWGDLVDYLSRPSIGDAKGAAGGYSPALYRENVRRKPNLIRIWLLVVDIDGNGDVDRVADELGSYSTIVHETFSSTNDDPRCRVVLRLADPVDATTYETTHEIVRTKIRVALDCAPDDGAKDASRVSYLPVRRAGAGYRFRHTAGRPLDAKRVIAAQPPKPVMVRAPVEVKPEHKDKYRQAALRRAADAILSASVGARHEILNKEAYALARLDLSREEIADALIPAFVSSAGEARRYEAVRTIADAVRARKGAAA